MSKAEKNRGLVTAKHSEAGFTLIELLIVIAIIALLMGILIPALTRAKEMGKRAVCLNQIKQLQLAWNMYVDENNDKVPSADIYYSRQLGPPNYPVGGMPAWYELPHTRPPCNFGPTGRINNPTQADWEHSISDGLLWKFIKDYKIYQCPVGERNERVTYTMSHCMNTWPGSGGTTANPAPTVKFRNQIKRAADRIAFIDEGRGGSGAFFISYSDNPLTWADDPPVRHGKGTTFSFIDGHAAYRKWTDKHTLAYIAGRANGSIPWGGQTGDNSDCDLRWMVRVSWGNVLWPNPTPNKKCDEF